MYYDGGVGTCTGKQSSSLFITLQKNSQTRNMNHGTFPFAQPLPYLDRRLL